MPLGTHESRLCDHVRGSTSRPAVAMVTSEGRLGVPSRRRHEPVTPAAKLKHHHHSAAGQRWRGGIIVARKAFFSFHYKADNWRASKVRNIGVIEGNQAVSDNQWESITKGGSTAIRSWIDGQMFGRSCVIVLIGYQTAGRYWINYEIEKAWADRKGVVGIYVHNLTDQDGHQASKGSNPFDSFTINGRSLSQIVRAYNPPYTASASVRNHIADNIESWVEEAISIRGAY